MLGEKVLDYCEEHHFHFFNSRTQGRITWKLVDSRGQVGFVANTRSFADFGLKLDCFAVKLTPSFYIFYQGGEGNSESVWCLVAHEVNKINMPGIE